MAQATKNPPDTLEAQASALVANPVIDLDSLAADAVENLESQPANLEQAAADLVSAPPTPVTPSPDLAEAVQKLIQDTPAPTPAPAPAADKIETLDAQIANIADDLIAGDFADEQGSLKGQVAAPPLVVETPKVAEAVPPPAPEPVAVAAAAPPVIAPAQPVTTPQAAPRTAAPPPAAAPSSAERRKPVNSAAKVAATHGAKAAATLRPVGLGMLALVAGPIRDRPKVFRDMVGWVAVVTIFNAGCLWMYVLFFRSATPPPPKPAVATAHDAGHGKDAHAKADSHGKKDAKADSHGKAAGGHGAPEKKKATKTAAKKPAKKDAKQASHGGGH